jgi:hypothetical protein
MVNQEKDNLIHFFNKDVRSLDYTTEIQVLYDQILFDYLKS